MFGASEATSLLGKFQLIKETSLSGKLQLIRGVNPEDLSSGRLDHWMNAFNFGLEKNFGWVMEAKQTEC